MSRESRDLFENRMRLINSVHRYQTRRNPVEHERLRDEVEALFGPLEAEFFDREGTLPPTKVGLDPWPLYAWEVVLFGVVQILVVCGVAVLGVCAGREPVKLLWACVVAMVALLTMHVLVPWVLRWFPPRDIDERERLFEVYRRMALICSSCCQEGRDKHPSGRVA